MGKRTIQRRRGKGTNAYKSPSHRFKDDAKYMPYAEFVKGGLLQVIDLLDDPGRSAPLALTINGSFEEDYILACEGMSIGDLLEFGEDVSASNGNILLIGKILNF